MFGRIFGKPAPRRLPPGPEHEIFAIGDIHGRLDLLKALIGRIAKAVQTDRPELVLLGDYIDRGPDSRGVIDFLLDSAALEPFDTVFLKGNHEAALLDFLQKPDIGRTWMTFGGLETLASYGVSAPLLKTDPEAWREASEALARALPATHLGFYRSLKLFAERGRYFFVHAGVDPDTPIESQNEQSYLWIREAFLDDDRLLDRIIVHGHTPAARPFADLRRVGLDTGAYQTGVLTAAQFIGTEVRFYTT